MSFVPNARRGFSPPPPLTVVKHFARRRTVPMFELYGLTARIIVLANSTAAREQLSGQDTP